MLAILKNKITTRLTLIILNLNHGSIIPKANLESQTHPKLSYPHTRYERISKPIPAPHLTANPLLTLPKTYPRQRTAPRKALTPAKGSTLTVSPSRDGQTLKSLQHHLKQEAQESPGPRPPASRACPRSHTLRLRFPRSDLPAQPC